MPNRLKSSAEELRNLRSIAECGILIALYVVTNTLSIYITPTLKLTFSYLVFGIIGWRFGVVTGALAGAVCDITAYIVYSSGALHLGFTLSAALTCAVFGAFLYRREISVWRVIVSRSLINILINIALNTFWLSNLYGKAYIVLLGERVVKNLVLLPVEITLLYVVLIAARAILAGTQRNKN